MTTTAYPIPTLEAQIDALADDLGRADRLFAAARSNREQVCAVLRSLADQIEAGSEIGGLSR